MERVLSKNRQTLKPNRKAANIIIGLSLTLLAVAVLYWLEKKSYGSIAGLVGALANVALFAALGIRFIPLWIDSWSVTRRYDVHITRKAHNKTNSNKDSKTSKGTLIKVFFSFLLVDIVIILFVYFLQIMSGKGAPFHQALNLWKATDSGHYLAIAQDWYLKTGVWDRLVQLVFLPGYPVLIRVLNVVIGNYLYTAMVISGLCFAGAGTMLYQLIRLDYSHEEAIRALKYLCILPGAFFFAAPMSESMFLFLSVTCIYFLRKKSWLAACVLGGVAAFTRSLGLVLLIPTIFEMITDDVTNRHKETSFFTAEKLKRMVKYTFVLLILLGFGCYLLINYQVSRNPFQFMIYQKQHWYQSMGFFFNTVSYQIDYAIRSAQELKTNTLLGLWLPNLFCLFTSLCIMLAGVKKIRPSYTAYFLIYYIVSIGATWLLSGPRYLLVLIPIPIALAVVTKKTWLDNILTIAYTVLFVLYTYMFVNRWSVW